MDHDVAEFDLPFPADLPTYDLRRLITARDPLFCVNIFWYRAKSFYQRCMVFVCFRVARTVHFPTLHVWISLAVTPRQWELALAGVMQ